MKTSLARTNAILSIEANENLTGHVGRFVVLSSGKAALVTTTAQPVDQRGQAVVCDFGVLKLIKQCA